MLAADVPIMLKVLNLSSKSCRVGRSIKSGYSLDAALALQEAAQLAGSVLTNGLKLH